MEMIEPIRRLGGLSKITFPMHQHRVHTMNASCYYGYYLTLMMMTVSALGFPEGTHFYQQGLGDEAFEVVL